jgi:protein-S-isoprenylcysteine O-methyltransferase Ste14
MTLDHKIPPPVVGLALAVAMWFAAAAGPALPLPAGARHIATIALVVAGLGFDLAGLLAFRAQRTTVNPLAPQRASALVTGGVYRVTRNPMYVGMACLLLAWAVYLAALLPFSGPVLFVLYITRFQIRPEERVLQGLFGAEYFAYCSRVRRWL